MLSTMPLPPHERTTASSFAPRMSAVQRREVAAEEAAKEAALRAATIASASSEADAAQDAALAAAIAWAPPPVAPRAGNVQSMAWLRGMTPSAARADGYGTSSSDNEIDTPRRIPCALRSANAMDCAANGSAKGGGKADANGASNAASNGMAQGAAVNGAAAKNGGAHELHTAPTSGATAPPTNGATAATAPEAAAAPKVSAVAIARRLEAVAKEEANASKAAPPKPKAKRDSRDTTIVF